jgi:hypothetical protein
MSDELILKKNLITLYTQPMDDLINVIGTYTEDKIDEAIDNYIKKFIVKLNECSNSTVTLINTNKKPWCWTFQFKYEEHITNGVQCPECIEWQSIYGILITPNDINNFTVEFNE